MMENRSLEDMIYLCGCAVKGDIPDPRKIRSDWDALYDTTEEHLVNAAVGMALESAGIQHERFQKGIAQAQRKNALLDADRSVVLAELERAGIWYMPLKGAILKELYPRYGMRQMADNDILFDAARAADVKDIMTGLGFTVEEYDHGNHDTYHKKPVSNFEMHRDLFSVTVKARTLLPYYRDVQRLLVKDEGNAYGYHLKDEDFYVFMIAHEYKHYLDGGNGLRTLLDIYVFLNQKEDRLDWSYIAAETGKLEIREYEELSRHLARNLFEGAPLSSAEQEMLEYILSSKAYGVLEHKVDLQIQEKGRMGFFFSRLFLPMDIMKMDYPAMRKAPFLYPVFWIYRLVSKLFSKPEVCAYEVKRALGIETEETKQK